MNKVISIGVLFASFQIGFLAAQDAQSELKDVPPPKVPFVNRAPAKSAWVIEIKPNGKGPSAPSSNPNLPPKYLKRQYWTKSGTMMRCVNEWTDGSKTQDWVVEHLKFYQGAQGDGIRVFDPRSHPFFHDFSSSDFEMIDWITSETYVRAVKYEGEACHLFEAKKIASPGSEPRRDMKTVADFHAPTSATSALINIQTGLPVAVVNGDGQFRFQFQPTPAGELQIPEPYASLWKAYNVRR